MSSQALMITKTDYEDKKEYWDYQRLLEFNKEALKHKLLKVQGKVFTPMGELSTDDLFDDIWSKISSDELEKPLQVGYQRMLNIDLNGKVTLMHLNK